MTAAAPRTHDRARSLSEAEPLEVERQRLEAIWRSPRGWRVITEVNNTVIGYFYIATAFLFFLLAGILALLIRLQLAVPGNDFLSPDTYNQIFTMHGTVMMFLFAVPAVEAAGILLLPQMLGARDLPFPRLGAFAFWAYFVGGLVFFCTLFFGTAPDGGWFMYPPLTGERFSPGIGADWWLLGIGFIEISAIAGAIEIIVGVLRTRAPGMTLTRMPIFAWTLLIFAGMIVFAFPAVILATILLELERAFGWPFFIAEKGGDPLLWQHLFWFFGHPEVYIIFLPAAGMVSMIVPTMARVPLVGYHLIVVALIAVGFFSFGLWVHHMFTTGIPSRSLGFFSAASMAVAIPSGIQVFAWIATIAAGRLRLTVPSLFVIGFLVIFTLGGLTGVMVAMVPFDRQAHDSYFVVAHLHYVLFGGMVFPLFAAIYYWAPAFSRRPLSERLGRWAFALIFLGFNVAFLPMHVTGLIGMPRRVYTYPAGLGWETPNLISTFGALMLAMGILIFLCDGARNIRLTKSEPAGDLWLGGTLEWLPNQEFGTRSIPRVEGREPLWDHPDLAREVEAGEHYLPRSATGARETIVTSPIEAEPQYVMRLTGPSYSHFAAAVFTAGFFLLLTVKAVVLAGICGLGAIVAIMVWMWECDPARAGDIDIGGGITLPSYASGALSHSWWAMVVLLLVAAALYLSYLFGYVYLWTVAPQFWPGVEQLPEAFALLGPLALVVLSGGLLEIARRLLGETRRRNGIVAVLLLFGAIALAGAIGADILQHWQAGLRPQASGYAAMVYANAALQAQIAGAVLLIAGFAAARLLAGRVDRIRRVVFDNLALLWAYSLGQATFGLVLTHGFPRLVAG
ncbi:MULTISPECIES: cytochrome c oxidase subunit I [unclassified Chelatococcus]|uniref:cytochrome c oxidase subunit I n=1 Tax=unclassified Chelatococcus TaxID=2638111 RepID=UPI001BCB5C92|nr:MULTISPECIES: cytochrome c oxidase subunit I [unclassified Chelatococcus]MBS7699935.1 cytochrome c oxidase subunit I [Chelatococcus sp. YT9]MBX3558640.1 cytochrome c oxidase subunit I [Chelatococcus sp.]